MPIQAWPFLVSRNKSLGYQTIVAPDFMVDAKITGLLANEAGGNLTDHLKYQELRQTKVGNLTLAYRVVRATDGDEVYRDEVGRPILWIEGVVLKGLHKNVVITERDLQEVHRHVVAAFKEFWGHTGSVSVKHSRAFITSSEKDMTETTSAADTSKTGNDEKGIKDIKAHEKWIEERYKMRNGISPLAFAAISALLVAIIIFNIIQAGKIASLEERVKGLEQTVELLRPTVEDSKVQPTPTP